MESLPERPDETGVETPPRRFLFLPDSHSQALRSGRDLVIGARGTGKSFWWSVLKDDSVREALLAEWPWLQDYARVTPGFGQVSDPDRYPSQAVLRLLLAQGFEAQTIWRTVVLNQVTAEGAPGETWAEKVAWASSRAEEAERALDRTNREMRQSGRTHLVLFDALDHAANSWEMIRELVRGLLRLMVEFRGVAGIRMKAFLRPDLLQDPEVLAFPDSSKLETSKVELTWPRRELYNLLWQHLGNARSGGETFRSACASEFGLDWTPNAEVFQIPLRLRREEEIQRRVFHALAGDRMGRDARRGFPYTWLPNHLGDAHEQVSPRTFLAALRRASEESQHRDGPFALHFEAIKSGVQWASRIRVREMGEDYPWVARVFEPLAGLAVPASFEEIAALWKAVGLPGNLTSGVEDSLPPSQLKGGVKGLRRDLEDLGLFQTLSDGRINIPDVYRVGFGMSRRGGVKPVK